MSSFRLLGLFQWPPSDLGLFLLRQELFPAIIRIRLSQRMCWNEKNPNGNHDLDNPLSLAAQENPQS
jgi:hypothetical protein